MCDESQKPGSGSGAGSGLRALLHSVPLTRHITPADRNLVPVPEPEPGF